MRVVRFFLFIQFILFTLLLKGQEYDTIRVAFDQVLMLKDTAYFGTKDSLVVLPKDTNYDLLKNFLVRRSSYYERKPHRKESAIRLNDKYGRLLMGHIYHKNLMLPEEFNPADNYFSFYKAKVIKEIQIEAVPVLDGNVFDTTNVDATTVGRFLNKTYTPTKEKAIRNNLKFKENDAVSPRILSDNERLLRNLSYIEDARIQIVPLDNSFDSVNVLVIVKDRYPIGLGGNINDYNAFEIEPYTRNFMGLGHNIGAVLQFDGSTDEKFGYGAYYAVNNIAGTFINSKVQFNRGLDIDIFRAGMSKPFLTTNTKTGGELIYEKLAEKIVDRRNIPDSVYDDKERYGVNRFDLWLGYSFLFEHAEKHPFLNLAGRFYSEYYTRRPVQTLEYNFPFHNKNLYLASLSFQQISYIKTTQLVQYGTIEDVPVGLNLNLTGGWMSTSYSNRPYLGARVAYTTYFQNAGIFSARADIGAFHEDADFEDAVSAFTFGYMSPLLKWQGFEVRNLFQLSYNAVYNPRYLIPLLYADYLFDNEDVDGFYGEANFVLNYHPIFYTRYNLWGFRFSFDPFIDIGWVNQAEYQVNNWDAFTLTGINLSTKNESLIFPAMHLQFGYYVNGIKGEPHFKFKIVFKDIKLFQKFTSLKPETALPVWK